MVTSTSNLMVPSLAASNYTLNTLAQPLLPKTQGQSSVSGSADLLQDAAAKADFVQAMARQVAESMAQELGANTGVRVKIKVDLPAEGPRPKDSMGQQFSLESQAYSSSQPGKEGKPLKTSVSWNSKANNPALSSTGDKMQDNKVEDKQFQQQLQQFTQQLDQSLQQLLTTLPQNELNSPWLNSYAPSPVRLAELPFSSLLSQQPKALTSTASSSQDSPTQFWA